MQRYLRGGLTGLLIAIAAWAASCERSRTPAQPTATDAARTQTLTLGATGDPLTVSWHCMAAGAQFVGVDCAARATGQVRLTSRAALTAPGTPSNLGGGVTGARVSLAWTAPAGGDPTTSYVVEAGSASGRLDLANFDTGTSAPSLTVDNVPAGTYFIRVRARNSAGVSGASNELVLIVFGSAGCPPAAPTGLTASATGSTVTLLWTAPGGACTPAGYIIEAGSAPGAANLANFNTGTTSTTFVAGGVGAGTYYVRVRATNAAGVSAASNEATLIVGGSGCTAPPPAPGGLTGSVTGTTVSLSWNAVPGAASYLLEAGTGSGLSNVVVSNQGTATSLTAVASPGTYYVRVRATNACGTSGASNEIVLGVGSTTQCSYIVSPTTASLPTSGGTVSVGVTTGSNCAWSASSNDSFITISSGANGTGNGVVTFSIGANPGSASRTGTLTIAGQTVTVTQTGACSFTLSGNQISVDAAGGSATIGVTPSPPSCIWSSQSNSSFVILTGGGSGTGNVSLLILSNAGPSSRSGSLTIAGINVAVNQNAPLPEGNVTRNQGCPGQEATPLGATTIQFINQRNETITVFRPGTTDSSTIPPLGGLNKSTFAKTVWQVSVSGNGCLASFTAEATPGSAIVR